MLKHIGWLLNLAAVAAVVWGAWSGFQTYERALSGAHLKMQARFDYCSQAIRENTPDEPDRMNLLTLGCSEALDDDRWMPVYAPNLYPDAFVAAAVPIGAGLAMAVLALLISARPRPSITARPRSALG